MHLSLSDICFTLAEKRQHFFYRFAAVCSTMEELAATMEYAIIEGYRSGIQKNYGFSFSSCGFTDSSLIEEDAYGLYQAMNDYLTNGCIDWNSLRFHKDGKALHLPTYRFDAKRFWAAGASSHKPVSRPLRKFHNASDTDITEELRRMFTKVLGVEAVSEKESFFDLGGDSFFAIQLLEDIQQGFGLTLTFENLVQYSSLGELATYIYKKANI